MLDFVQRYYGEVLEKTSDLRTDACCTIEAPAPHVSAALARIHEEVSARYYGCGLVIPEALDGCRVLDLGCGAGRDAYLLAQLVGPDGEIVGVDMTPGQLEVAARYREWHAERFGYPRPNVSLQEGYIERLEELALEPGSFDIVVSNCVVNLSPDKAAVLRGAYRLLKPGGEIYFADVYADRRVPADVASNPVLYGECLGGALYWNDFLALAQEAGFGDPRLVTDRAISVADGEMRAAVGDIRFYSATYRLFKLPGLEAACEDYGQSAVYRGTIEHHADKFVLDAHHAFATGEPVRVCGNTFEMLARTRLAAHFELSGDRSRHLGIFPDCGTAMPFGASGQSTGACC